VKNKKLLFSVTKKDLKIQTFRSGGKGGQHQNKTDSGIRIIHPESGAVGECREYRSQLMSKREAFKRMTNHLKFKIWINQKVWECENQTSIEDKVKEMLQLQYLKIECKENGKWKEYNQQEKGD